MISKLSESKLKVKMKKISKFVAKKLKSKMMSNLLVLKLRSGQDREPMHGYLIL